MAGGGRLCRAPYSYSFVHGARASCTAAKGHAGWAVPDPVLSCALSSGPPHAPTQTLGGPSWRISRTTGSAQPNQRTAVPQHPRARGRDGGLRLSRGRAALVATAAVQPRRWLTRHGRAGATARGRESTVAWLGRPGSNRQSPHAGRGRRADGRAGRLLLRLGGGGGGGISGGRQDTTQLGLAALPRTRRWRLSRARG